MLRSAQYAAFAEALAERGVTLRTSGEQYRRAHELPGWCSALAAVTPRSVWTRGADRADFDRARAELGAGPAVLRDYTKSMKHYWDEAAFIPDLDDGVAAWKVASRFLELREDDFVGGFVLRRFEQFAPAEVRLYPGLSPAPCPGTTAVLPAQQSEQDIDHGLVGLSRCPTAGFDVFHSCR